MSFAKLDHGIVNSSIWSEPSATRVLWITILALKDENGFVSASRSGLARIANITIDEFDTGIKCLESPDIDSRTSENEGKRIAKIEGGWVVLNNEKYRLHDDIQRDKTRERVRRYRERLNNVTIRNDTSTFPSVSVSESCINSISCLHGFEEFWMLYPKKVAKANAVKAWKKITSPIETLILIKKALEWQVNTDQWKKDGGQFIPYPATYLNANQWLDEPENNKTKWGAGKL